MSSLVGVVVPSPTALSVTSTMNGSVDGVSEGPNRSES